MHINACQSTNTLDLCAIFFDFVPDPSKIIMNIKVEVCLKPKHMSRSQIIAQNQPKHHLSAKFWHNFKLLRFGCKGLLKIFSQRMTK